MDIYNYLTKGQLLAIQKIISYRCLEYRKMNKMYYEPYTTMRVKHGLTSAVLSGFSPANMEIEGLKSEDVYYGLNNKLCQPEIISDRAVFHIYSDGSDLKNGLILKRCEEYNNNFDAPIYFIVRFKANLQKLFWIKILFLDSSARIIEETIVYDTRKKLIQIA